MWLQAARIGTLHVFSDAVNTARVHGIVGKRPFFEQILEMAAVERMVENGGQIGHYLGTFTVPDSLDQKITQRFALELQFAKYVEHLAPQGLTSLFKFFQQLAINVAFAGL